MLANLPYILQQISNPGNLVLLLVGNIIGMIFGAIPGLSGTLAVMLFMPLTYSMDAGTAIVFLISLWVGGCSGAFIGSVLLGIPGSASAVATCFDGYPMSKNGKAGKALAIGMIASFLGTFFSAIAAASIFPRLAYSFMILRIFASNMANFLGSFNEMSQYLWLTDFISTVTF